MIKAVSNIMTNLFIDKNVVDKEERDIYLYGSEVLLSELLCTIITLAIGFILGCFLKTVIYLIIYTSIRVYAGGYHAMSHKMCITVFNVLYIFLLFTAELLFRFNKSDILCLCTIFAILIIFQLSPVQDLRKPLDEYEIERYKRKAQRRTVFWGVLVLTLYIILPFAMDEMSYGMIAICEVALLLLIGHIKNRVCY